MKNQNDILCILLGICFGLLIGRKTSGKTEINEIIRQDTITIVKIDTICVPEPLPMLVELLDTVYINIGEDKEPELLVKERKTYQDSTYKAVISGYSPSLDYIETYNTAKTEYVYITEKIKQNPKKLGIGVQAGYGIGRNGLQPYIGIGVSYNLIRF